MNKSLLKKHISAFIISTRKDHRKYQEHLNERSTFVDYYQSFTKEKILSMTADDIFEYLSQLWAMLIWGKIRGQVSFSSPLLRANPASLNKEFSEQGNLPPS